MNIYEQWVYDRLRKEGFEVFTAYKDRGVDCVVTDGDFEGRHQRIQIKGSRTHGLRTDGTGLGWFQVSEAKLDERITDFWVFVWADAGKQGQWSPIFVVCPAGMLRERLGDRARASANGKLNLYLNHVRDLDKDRIEDTRDDPHPSHPDYDYTRYFQNWQPLWDAVGGKSA